VLLELALRQIEYVAGDCGDDDDLQRPVGPGIRKVVSTNVAERGSEMSA
jgi:hypothetical protein